MNILVFDIETIPDTETGRQIYNLGDLNAEDIAQVMFTQRRQETDGATDFLRLHLHKIVAISVVLASHDKLSVWSLGDVDSSEKYSPTLVSWNGGGFDLPVLHYRTLYHGITAARYWENGGNDQSFRWNNYLSRYHERHTDLMDVLAGYMPQCKAPLDQIATILGFPGKMGMSGAKVWDTYMKGDIEAIRNYCETDVLNTYLVYLRYELIRGRLTEHAYDTECNQVRDMLANETKPHLKEFLEAWQA